jgi:hypothetical protein
MNKDRRKELCAVANKLLSLKRTNNDDIEMDLDPFKNDLDMILSEEESYMDNVPENFQNGYRYQMAEEACNNIECAIDALDDGNIDDAISYIYSATV